MAEPGRRRAQPAPGSVAGLLVIDKPPGCTSHDVVARCRRVFGLRKVGHAGTLDPDATGVLLVGLGPVTRLLRFLSGLPKSYTAEVVLGVATSTLDASGDVTGTWDMSSVTLADVRVAASRLIGTISQIPPMVSAVQVGGRRLHDLARAGIEVERAPRTVTVTRFDVDAPVGAATGPHPGPVFAVSVDCSTGTYIRTLASDLGTALGGGAHVRNLRRTAVGPYRAADAVSLDDLSPAAILPPVAALPGLDSVTVTPEMMAAVGHGKVMASADLGVGGSGPWVVLGPAGQVLAVYEAHEDGRVKPAVVLVTREAGPREAAAPEAEAGPAGPDEPGTDAQPPRHR